jgi:hypothetical protein
MSTLPDSMQKRKLNISIMLKVPIDLEIEVLGVPSTNCHQTENKNKDKNIFNLIGDSQPEVMIDGASLAELDEDNQALVSQLVGQLEQKGKIFSMLSQTQDENKIADKCEYVDTLPTENFAVIQPQTPAQNQKKLGRFLDSFNDSFAFVVNTMGTVLFLGKLANYTWE